VVIPIANHQSPTIGLQIAHLGCVIECLPVAACEQQLPQTIVRGRSWRLPIVRGMLAVAFGAASMAYADTSLPRLALLFGVYVAGDGALAIAGALRGTVCGMPAWGLLARGLSGLAAGYLAASFAPGHPIGFYGLLIAWALLTGASEVVAGIYGYARLDGDMYQMLHGLVSLVLGMVLLLIPSTGLHAFFPLISLNIVMAGTLLLLLGLRTAALQNRL
jgi:uncharacterized membrane protein HdeD (DUF308 family)